MGTAFANGLQFGEQQARLQQAHKQALSDQELEQKANELVQNRQAIQQKLPTLLDANNQPTPEYHAAIADLTKNAQDLRELYHPDKNPGAIAKFGRILTDHLHITKPDVAPSVTTQSAPISVGGTQVVPAGAATTVTGPTPSEAKRYSKTTGADIAEAQSLAAAAPPSPEQQAKTSAAKTLAGIQSEFTNYDKLNPHAAGPDATPEEKEARQSFHNDVIQKAMGLNQHPNWKKYKLPGGGFQYFDVNRPDTIPPGASAEGTESADERKRADYQEFLKKNPDYEKNGGSFEKWAATESQKPSTSVPNEIAASYAKEHGIDMSALTPADWSYLQRKTALDKAIPTATTTTTLKQNLEGQWVPVTETNYKTPGGSITLVDPRGSSTQAAGHPTQPTSGASPKTGAKKATPQQLKKEAAARNPKSSARGNTSVGDPLFAAPNKQYNDTKVAYQSAIDRTKIMEKNLDNALKNNDQQAMLSLVANHIGMTLGAQKGARINQAVWNEAVESTPFLKRVAAKWGPDGYLSGVTLAPEQMRQMVELAKERTEIIKESLDTQRKALNAGVSHPSTTSQPTDDKDIDAIIQALNATKKK